MWEAISYVSSGVSLVAFIVAVSVWVLKSRIESRERLIKQAPADDRSDLVKNALEFFHVEAAGLTKEHQYKIALEQIRARMQRFRIVSIVVCFIALVAGGVAIFAIRYAPASINGTHDLSENKNTEHKLSIDDQQRVLNMIAELADRLCKDIPLQGSGENLELSEGAKAELNQLISDIIDLKIKEASKLQSNEYKGILQKDLVAALKNSTDCKLQVFKDLSEKLLGEK